MQLKRNIAIAFIGLMLGVVAIVVIYFYTYLRIDYSAIDYIYSFQKGAFKFNDLANDIGVTSIDDLGFEVKGDYDIIIHYGKQVIKVNKNCLDSKEFHQRISRIGLDIKSHTNEDGTILYRIECWGEPIEQWDYVT